MEFIILINGNSKLQTYVPGQKGHQSSIFQEFKRATFRFITDLKDLQMKKSSIEVVQFSGCLGMDGHYIPGRICNVHPVYFPYTSGVSLVYIECSGACGDSMIHDIPHYRTELERQKLRKVRNDKVQKEIMKIRQICEDSHLLILIQGK